MRAVIFIVDLCVAFGIGASIALMLNFGFTWLANAPVRSYLNLRGRQCQAGWRDTVEKRKKPL